MTVDDHALRHYYQTRNQVAQIATEMLVEAVCEDDEQRLAAVTWAMSEALRNLTSLRGRLDSPRYRIDSEELESSRASGSTKEALDKLTRLSEEGGLYDDEITKTRLRRDDA